MRVSEELLKAMDAAEQAVLRGEQDSIYGPKAGTAHVAPWPEVPAKIIFLDFDGVLNSEQSVQAFGTRYRFAQSNVAALNQILRQTGAWLVITSSWREGLMLAELGHFLERDGVLPRRVLGRTRSLEDQPRGMEIAAWLRSAPYPVSSFVILDDRDDMAMHQHRLVQTNPHTGLNLSHAERAIALLG